MKYLLAAYTVVFTLYLGTAVAVSLLLGAWTTNLITGASIAFLMSSLDAIQRYRAVRANRAKLEQYKQMLQSMGIDFDAMIKAQREQAAAAQAKAEANRN